MHLHVSSIGGQRIGRVRMIVRTAAIGAAFTFAAGAAAYASEGAVVVSSLDENGVVHAQVGAVTPAKGWQGPIDYTVPVGKNLLFSYECPSGLPVPISGSFNANTAAQKGITLAGNYRREDVTTDWAWAINWPTGAPAGSHIVFDLYCQKAVK